MIDVIYHIETRLIKRQLPTAWEEMTTAQYVQVCNILLMPVTEEEARLRMLKALLDISDYDFLRPTVKKRMNTKLMLQYFEKLFPELDYIFSDETLFVKNLLPSFKHNGKEYFGPSDKLLNVTGDEIEKAEFFYSAFSITQNTEHLTGLIATLYRPGNYDGNNIRDKRIGFDDALIAQQMEVFKTLPDSIVFAIRLWYERVMMSWMKQYKDVFSGGKEKKQPDPEAWRKLNRALAGQKRGTVDQVKKLFISDIMFELQQLEAERKEYDAFVERLKSKNK